MKIGQISCWISVAGQPLEEYGVVASEQNKECSAWIPSKPGLPFTINWRDPVSKRTTSGQLRVDGTDCGGTALRSPRIAGDEINKTHVSINDRAARPFQFGTLELTDDDNYLKKDVHDLGLISLAVWRIRVKGATQYTGVTISEPEKMHERAKRGLEHAVKFGATQNMITKGLDTEYLDKVPLATFTFRYRSLDMLRANGIAPAAAPAPPPSATTRPGFARYASSDDASSPASSAGRKRRASSAVTPEPQDVQPHPQVARPEPQAAEPHIDIVELEEAEERLRLAEELFRRAKQDVEQRRRCKKIKLEEVTGIISGEVIDLSGPV
ncbi:hypothetical protein BD626DRAFT_568275 [Schizophyllum amplum]|uniref:DUF7918 domain-containing protein n=1 Tax=Schizophyllum amplum TaxID=97359 RepID=A0A550CIC0_9AGAR|nr:hypothetical protein BD626DRAFT_568275 [Auriculariopsis ampla]